MALSKFLCRKPSRDLPMAFAVFFFWWTSKDHVRALSSSFCRRPVWRYLEGLSGSFLEEAIGRSIDGMSYICL